MLHLACLCALATAAFAPARAQDEPATSGETDAAEAEAATALDTIVVTGTRIPRTGFDTLEPAIVIDEQKIKDRGLTNIADILNETPGFGFGVTPEGGQSTFGVAVNFVNRFGLGTNRTLTLINGRRAVSSNTPSIFGPAGPGLQVDLNIIPALMVDRIENIAIGGAPTYGSDAIAGVVNVILKRDYEGIETTGTYALTDEGDGERWNAGAIGGWNFPDDVANVTLAVNYDKVDGVLQTERERFARGLSFQPNPLAPAIFTQQPGRTPQNDGRLNPGIPFNTGNTDGIPNSALIPNSRFFAFSTGGLVLPTGATNLAGGALRGFGPNSNVYLQFDRSGNLVPYAPGTNFGTLNSSGGDGWNIVDTGQLSSDLERRSVNFSGRYLIGDRAEFFIEGLYYDSDALEIIDQSIFNTPNFGGFSAALVIPVDYAQLSEAARAQLRALGVSSFRLSRASSDLVNNNGRSETQVYRSVLGFSGDFDLFERLFNWELTANWGRNDSEFFQTVLNQQNFTNALHVVRVVRRGRAATDQGRLGLPAVTSLRSDRQVPHGRQHGQRQLRYLHVRISVPADQYARVSRQPHQVPARTRDHRVIHAGIEHLHAGARSVRCAQCERRYAAVCAIGELPGLLSAVQHRQSRCVSVGRRERHHSRHTGRRPESRQRSRSRRDHRSGVAAGGTASRPAYRARLLCDRSRRCDRQSQRHRGRRGLFRQHELRHRRRE
jgi:outer membrane receptor protein involved in Fe transport